MVFCAEVDVLAAKEISSVTRVKLKNGLTVILEPNHSSPVAAINVWVKVGSACEGENERGIAHFHEHMLFKGTSTLAPGDLALEVESSGGRINAHTSFDQTVYHITVASRSLNRSIDLLADSVANSVFDPGEIEKEIEVVLEEIRRDKDSPESVMSRRLFASAYEKHPYGYPILGTAKSVSSFKRGKLLDFYRKWYSPGNIVVVVTGDFEKREALARVKKGFGALKERKTASCSARKDSGRKSPSVSVLKKEVNEGYFGLAFRIPGLREEDVAALDVISEAMGEGESSRLFRVVKEKKGLVNNVYSYSYTPRMGGIFVVGGTVKPENAVAAYEEILRMFYGLADEGLKNSEIEKAKLNIESAGVRSKETMQGRAHALGFYEAIAGDYQFEKTYMDKVRSVTLDDIRRVAAKYFTPFNLSAVAVVPIASVLEGRRLKQSILSVKPSSSAPDKNYKTGIRKLKNGIKVIIEEDKSVPLFAAQLLFPGGLRFENKNSNGISNFTVNMLTRGTATRSAEQIATEMESIAGYIGGFSGRDSAGISMEALSSGFDSAMDVFSDVVLNPSFPEDEAHRAKREILAAINKKNDNLASICLDGFFALLFKNGSYSRQVEGTPGRVKKFSRKDAADFYAKALNPEDMVVVVVGDVDARKVMARLEKDFSSLRRVPKPLAYHAAGGKSSGKPVVKVKKMPGKQQTHIAVGFPAPKIGGADYYPLQVLNAVLSGQGGRLFLRLRDEMSLAYSLSSFYGARVESGYFGVYIGTTPQKEKTARDEILAQFDALLENGVTEDEVKRARNKMVGDFEIGLQRNSARASIMGFDELYGVGWDEHKDFARKVSVV